MPDFQSKNEQRNTDISLQSLLETIEQDTASALAQDLQTLKKRTASELRVRVPYVAFMLGRVEVALPLHSILEIGYMPKATPLPHLPAWIKGIVQIRGEIFSAVDFLTLFKLAEERRGGTQRSYILFAHNALKFCLYAQKITGVIYLDEQQQARLADYTAEEQVLCGRVVEYLQGVYVTGSRRVFVLDSVQLGTARELIEWQEQ